MFWDSKENHELDYPESKTHDSNCVYLKVSEFLNDRI